MLKGHGSNLSSKPQSNNANTVMVGTSDSVFLEPVEKSKKKLSFREPEIIDYYMQMKGVANRLSKRMKSPKNGNKISPNPATKSCIYKNYVNEDKDINCNSFVGSAEDLNLEVCKRIFVLLSIVLTITTMSSVLRKYLIIRNLKMRNVVYSQIEIRFE